MSVFDLEKREWRKPTRVEDELELEFRSKFRCGNCMNWEVPEPPKKGNGYGWCQIFEKGKRTTQGNLCLEFHGWEQMTPAVTTPVVPPT